MIEQQLIEILKTKAKYEAIRLPENFAERLGFAPTATVRPGVAHNICYTYWTPCGDEAMIGWFEVNQSSIMTAEKDGDFVPFLELVKYNPDLHKFKLGSSDEEPENILLLIKDVNSWVPYVISFEEFRDLLRYKSLYVTVFASDQFANNVAVHWSRRDAVEDAKSFVDSQGWKDDYIEDVNDIEQEYPDDVASTTTESALIYHAQEEADRCEEYVSVFEVLVKSTTRR